MATLTARASEPAAPMKSEVPPLENGDHLTRAEFERRYDAMPGLKKAELIEGVVYMPSPVAHERHGRPHFYLVGWFFRYLTATAGVDGGDNSSLRLDLDNMPQPDAFLCIRPEAGGRIRISEDDYIEGAPELIAEVASSSVSYDLHEKFRVYRRNGVLEYVVWRVRDREVDWFILREGAYERLEMQDGVYRSRAFPGLWLDVHALVRGDHPRVAEVLNQGLAAPEHAAFVAQLQARAGGGPGPA